MVDPAPRQIPAPDAVQRALDLLKGAKRPLILLGKGAAYAQADADIRALVEKTGIPYLPMSMAKGLLPDTHAQSASAARSYVLAGGRRRDAGRRAPELAAVARQGQDLGRRQGRRSSSSRSTSRRPRSTATCAIAAPLIGDIGSCVSALLAGIGANWAKPPADWTGAIAERKDKNLSKMAATLAANPSPMNFHSALGVIRDVVKARPDAIVVNEGANTLDFARSIVDMYEPRKRLDVGTWGIMGIGMGFAVAAAVATGKPVIAIEGDSAFGFSGMEVETICRYNLPVCVVVFNNNGVYRGTDVNASGGARRGADGVRQERALRQADGGLRRRRRPRHHRRTSWTRRLTEAVASGRPTLINAVIDETAGTESGRITSLNPQARRRRSNPQPTHRRYPHEQTKPLDGIKIIDFTHVQAGPACTQMLAWFGADVIKVERPGSGDVTRSQLRDIPDVDALYFTMLNSNKRSLTLDTKTPEGKEVLEKLISESDVMVENFGPGALDRMGFTWERILELNPKMILASVKGFTRRPPLRGPEGLRERRAVRRRRRLDHRLLGRPADRQRRRAGRQQHRHAPGHRHPDRPASARQDRQGPEGRLLDAGRRAEPVPRQDARPAAPGPRSATSRSTRSTRTAPSPTSCRAAATPAAAASRAGCSSARAGRPTPTPTSTSRSRATPGRRSATRIGKPEWKTDPDYTTPKARQPHITDDLRDHRGLAGRQDQVRGGRHPAQVRHPLLAGAVDEGDSPHDPSLRKSGSIVEVDAQGARQATCTVGSPIKFSDMKPEITGSPLLGEHTDEVLAELGYSKEQIADAARSQGGLSCHARPGSSRDRARAGRRLSRISQEIDATTSI